MDLNKVLDSGTTTSVLMSICCILVSLGVSLMVVFISNLRMIRFGIKDAKPVSTPMVHHFKLTSSQSPSTDEEEKFMAIWPIL